MLIGGECRKQDTLRRQRWKAKNESGGVKTFSWYAQSDREIPSSKNIHSQGMTSIRKRSIRSGSIIVPKPAPISTAVSGHPRVEKPQWPH